MSSLKDTTVAECPSPLSSRISQDDADRSDKAFVEYLLQNSSFFEDDEEFIIQLKDALT